MLSVYIHIPFCLAACPYCNFNFRLLRHYSGEFLESYVKAVAQEWRYRSKAYGTAPKLRSIYFGGGTPSVLPAALLSQLLEAFAVDLKGVEVTLEANPENLLSGGEEYLRRLRDIGFNRISLGVQSFDNKILRALGRHHEAKDIYAVVESARNAGISNLSCDLIGAAPGQTLELLHDDLNQMLSLNPEHISYYSLTIEEKTPFFNAFHRGDLDLPPESLQAEMYLAVCQALRQGGYTHYEISNFAKPNCFSIHNANYWQFSDYLGLGAGAHSFTHADGVSVRSMNEKEPRHYVETIAATEHAVVSTENLLGRQAMGEFVFTGLRLLTGIRAERFKEVFGRELREVFNAEINEACEQGLLEAAKTDGQENLKLTERGVLFSDTVFEYFV